MDITTIELPAESCAGYMCREELRTVSLANQATVLCDAKELYLNSDGTTKNQGKLNATAFNGVVISFQSTSESPQPRALKLEKFDSERNETTRPFSGADSSQSFVKIWLELIEANLSSGISNPKKHSTQSKGTMIVV
uniref:Uncharacterized protein n=1 Tax=Amphimedon queenslandica TaxID=400682 RepID=A0A1X7UCI4_AMPQE